MALLVGVCVSAAETFKSSTS